MMEDVCYRRELLEKLEKISAKVKSCFWQSSKSINMMFALLQLCSTAITRVKRQIDEHPLTVEAVLGEFELTNDTLRRMMDDLNRGMDSGLRDGLIGSSLAMLPSFVPGLTDGTERGKFLALDLGGTNLRVLLMDVDSVENASASRNFRIPNSAMTGTGTELFDFIADCMYSFLDEKRLTDVELPLGFTFSYPCDQTSLHSAVLLRWTKGFTASGVVGENVVEVLRSAVERNGKIKIGPISLINDTVGTLVSSGEEYPNCILGVIIATGTNAAYIERTENIRTLQVAYPFEEMIIDTEWGAFGDRGEIDYIKTRFDRIVDARSVHPGIYSFDKLVAGMYMGEVTRLVLEKLVKSNLLFSGRGSDLLFTIGSFPTKFISEILGDQGGYMYNARQVLEELGIDGYTYADLLILREVCMVVSRRSANLAAAAIACVVNRLGRRRTTVGIDGSTYRFHPFFHAWVNEKVRQLLDPNIELNLVLANDGSGKGAALVAAIAQKLEMEK